MSAPAREQVPHGLGQSWGKGLLTASRGLCAMKAGPSRPRGGQPHGRPCVHGRLSEAAQERGCDRELQGQEGPRKVLGAPAGETD